MFLSPYILSTLPIFLFTCMKLSSAGLKQPCSAARSPHDTPPIKPSAATTRTNRSALTRPLHFMPSCVLKACLGLIMFKQGFSTHCKSTSFEPVCKLLSKIKGYILQCVSKNCAPSFILLRWPADNRQGPNDVTATCLVFKQFGVHFP